MFCGSTGVLLGNSTFRDMITRLLREEMRLGPEVTATDLRRAVVDYFMAGDFTDDTRIGALPPPPDPVPWQRASWPGPGAGACAAR